MKLSRLGDRTDEIIPRVLQAGGEVVLSKVRSSLSSVVGKGTKTVSRSTGELERALGLSPAKQKRDGSGWDIKIGFAEPRSRKGGSNAKVANVLEYGKHGQPPKPFMRPAKTQSRKAAIDAMQAAFIREVDSI